MADTKLRFYVASLMALNHVPNSKEAGDGLMYWEHSGTVILAESIEMASLDVKRQAFEMWPMDLGWIRHSVEFRPPGVTRFQPLRGIARFYYARHPFGFL